MGRTRATPRLLGFGSTAMVGYAAVVLLLAVDMVFTLRRLEVVSAEQIARVRAEESQITHAERLRWNGELMVSAGRGYLITGNEDLFAKLLDVQAGFDANVATLGSTSADALVADVRRAALAFSERQARIIEARRALEPPDEVAARFESELMPLRRDLARALDELVRHKEAAIEDAYGRAADDGARLAGELYALLGVVVMVGLAVGFYFALRLAESYRQEASAHEAARNAVVARDELMGIVAHDLRNPLGAITMKAGLLGRSAEQGHEHVRRQAESIENIAMRMEYLIRTMLDVTTLEAGKFSIDASSCDVADVLRESLELFSGLGASKQISVDSEAKEPGLVVVAERERLLQVLSNLLGNALKLTPSGGSVKVAAERQGAMVRFAVSDTGPGISSSDAPHVFDRFWKREIPGKKGTGLGLFIAKGIVKAHGGRIWIESERGRGATFYFTIPVAAAEDAPSTVAPREMPAPA